MTSCTSCASAAIAEQYGDDASAVRDVLPSTVQPSKYTLTLVPDLKTFTFDGHLEVQLQFHEATQEVHMNASELEFDVSKSTLQVGDRRVGVERCELDAEREIVIFRLAERINAGTQATLVISYKGSINDKLSGFYRSSFVDTVTGEREFLGCTQFEATSARKALPCWDEPAVKAVFAVRIVVPEGITALSNMDEIARNGGRPDGRVEVVFRDTPAMSTYLLAWIVGPHLDHIETKTKRGTLVRVFSHRGTLEQGRFALDVAARTLDFFEEYFAEPYPLPKMDLAAIPDFGSGAMENWGLVTYRTVCLLFDESGSSLKTKQRVAYVVGHELAHQWFGNLVTMEWWSDLWLNEGFATWVGWLAVDHLFPQWSVWDEFVVSDCQAGLGLDGMRSSHAIQVPVKNPAEIDQIFDSISYSKGASVIRMLVTFLGESTFQQGMRAYLRKHKYGNARTADLWAALSEASGRDVNAIMSPWTKRMGYPVVQVAHHAEGEDGGFSVRQSRFLNSGSPTEEEDRTVWPVPVHYATDRGVDTVLMEGRECALPVPADSQYLKVNSGQSGFYRVTYPADLLDRLGKAVQAGRISAADRVGIVADLSAASKAGLVPVTDVLDALRFFSTERDYNVWSEISGFLAGLLSVWWTAEQRVQGQLNTLVRSLYSGPAASLGFDPVAGESDHVALLRPILLAMAARAGDQTVIGEALARFARFTAPAQPDLSAINPTLRSTVFQIVMREGGAAEFDALLSYYKSTPLVDQKLAALGALPFGRHPDQYMRALNLAMDVAVVRPQDIIYVFSGAAANPAARAATWQFVKQHWTDLHQRYYKGSISLLSRIVSSSTQRFSSEEAAKEVEHFFADKDTKSIDRAIAQSLESIRLNSQWYSANASSVQHYLNQQQL